MVFEVYGIVFTHNYNNYSYGKSAFLVGSYINHLSMGNFQLISPSVPLSPSPSDQVCLSLTIDKFTYSNLSLTTNINSKSPYIGGMNHSQMGAFDIILPSLFKTVIFQCLINAFQATLRRALVPPAHPGTSSEIRRRTCGTSSCEPGGIKDISNK